MKEEERVKFKDCQYCGSKDLHWTFESTISKWVLNDPCGLPHSCSQQKDYWRNKFKQQAEDKKKQYQDYKAQIQAMPDSSLCFQCNGAGGSYLFRGFMKCTVCYGAKRMTAKVKNSLLYKRRKQLWPQMFEKKKNDSQE